MALTDESSGGIPATMLVGPASFGNGGGMPYPVPMYSGFGGGSQGGNNGWGDGGWWIVLLIIVIAALGGNWGGNNNGGGGAFGGGQPIIVNDGGGSSVQRGFDQAAVMSGVNSLQSGISGLSTQLCGCCCDMQGTVNNGFANVQQSLCSGFAGVNSTVNGAQNAIAQQLYTNQIADLERSFAAQTASTQGMTSLQSQLAQCCCDNRLATESLRATVLSENCADRYEAANNTRDIIDSQTRSTQAILDKLCQLELDNYKRENDNLRGQLSDARFAASQIAQTAQIRDGQTASVNALVNELRSCPIPSQPVYGSQPIFSCPNNNGCGCGCGNNVGGFNGNF